MDLALRRSFTIAWRLRDAEATSSFDSATPNFRRNYLGCVASSIARVDCCTVRSKG